MAINRLLEAKSVEKSQNPAHRRSNLLVLTTAGKKFAESLREKEGAALADVELGMGTKELEGIAESLSAISKKLDRAKG
jgi:DNA-binding MarR family transcriptional regulator